MTGAEFRHIRQGLLLSQSELAKLLGYRQPIRISEFERTLNQVPVPPHIEEAMLKLMVGKRIGKVVRKWKWRD